MNKTQTKKNNQKKAPVIKPTSTVTKHHKRLRVCLYAIVAICLVIVALVTVARYYDSYIEREDRRNVETMRNVSASLVADLGKLNGVAWKDHNKCVVTKPRMFGEEVNYYCYVHYSLNTHIETEADAALLAERIRGVVRLDSGVYDVEDEVLVPTGDINTVRYSSTSFEIKEVNIGQGKCFITYDFSKTDNVLVADLSCSTKVIEPYFAPIEYQK